MTTKVKGFTLVELMITLAVAAIVMGIAIPSFTQMMRNNSSATLGAELAGVLQYARSEAIKRAARVSVCASDDGLSCLAAGNWEKGWLVFVDTALTDSAPDPVIADADAILRYWDDLNTNAVITANLEGGAAIRVLRFTGTGTLARANLADTAAREFVVSITGCKGSSARTLSVGVVGMVNTVKSDCP